MLKQKFIPSRLNLSGSFLILLLPFMLLACGDAVATPVADQAIAATTAAATQAQAAVQVTSAPTTRAAVTSKTTTKPASSATNSKAPASGETACALVSKEDASTILGVSLDKSVPQSTTGFSCNYLDFAPNQPRTISRLPGGASLRT